MDLITKTVLAVDTATVTFNSIPQTYTDLVLHIAARGTLTGQTLFVTVNNDATALYSTTRLFGSGSSATSGRTSGGSNLYTGYAATSAYTASTFGSAVLTFPNYTAATNKVIVADTVAENNNATAWAAYLTAGLYRSTTAISRIDIAPDSANWLTGSTFWLWGISHV